MFTDLTAAGKLKEFESFLVSFTASLTNLILISLACSFVFMMSFFLKHLYEIAIRHRQGQNKTQDNLTAG